MCLILTTYLNSNQPHFKCSVVRDSQWLLYGMAFFWKDFKFAPGERFWRIENHGRKKLLSLYVLLFCFDFFPPKCVNQFYFLTRSFRGKEKHRKSERETEKAVILEVGGDFRQAGAMSGRSREESFSEDEEEEGVEEKAVP